MQEYVMEIMKEGRNVIVIIPFNAKELFNKPKGTIYIKGTINGIQYKSKLISKGNNVQFMQLNKEMQRKIGFSEDSMFNVNMTFEEDNIISFEEKNAIQKCEMNLITTIVSRASIRKYSDKKISDVQLNTILNAGFCAPSAQNKRPWHFIIVDTKEKLKEISINNKKAKMIENATACIIVCGDKCVQGLQELLIEDCSAATQNMLLATHGLGLGAVWCGVVLKSEWYQHLIDILKLPDKVIPVAVISLGYPNEEKVTENRFEPIKVHNNVW